MRYSPIHIIFLFVGFLHIVVPCLGQTNSHAHRSDASRDSLWRHISLAMSAEASFRFAYPQGSSAIQADLQDNAAELDRLSAFIGHTLSYPEYSVSRICLTSYSSIEGDYSHNELLSHERVEQFYLYLREHYPDLYRFPHNLAWVAEDWVGFSRLVRESEISERDEILSIIQKVPVHDDRELLLLKLNGGRAFNTMKRTIFPRLRRVELRIEYQLAARTGTEEPPADPLIHNVPEKKEEPLADPLIYNVPEKKEELPADSLIYNVPEKKEESPADSLIYNVPEKKEESPADSLIHNVLEKEEPNLHDNRSLVLPLKRTTRGGWEYSIKPAKGVRLYRFALKTNLLLWAGVQHDLKHTAPVANAALEYYITPNWSAELGAMYSYRHYNSNRKFQGISGYRLEPRYYFPLIDNRFEPYLGIYGRVGDYDKTAEASGATGDYWDAGLSAGVFIKLCGGLGLEAGTRVGYLKTNAVRYTPDNQYNWYHREKKYNKIKITDISLNLVYRFKQSGIRSSHHVGK